MRYLRKPFKIILILSNLLFILIGLYIFLSVVLTIIPVNTNFTETENGVNIFISSNGVHTDVIVPANTSVKNWSESIPPGDFILSPATYKYLVFGWGDRGFYLNTPTWSDLKASTAFNALFIGGKTVMHVSYLNRMPVEDKYTRSIHISYEQYKELVKYIEGSFQTDSKGNYLLLNGYHYNSNDNFYEAKGSYYFYRTCNTWTNTALKHAGVKTAFWAPFDESVFFHLERKKQN